MPWFQIDDGFTTNPKTRSLLDLSLEGDDRGLAAIGLWVAAGSDINQSTLDGIVSRAGLVRIALNPAKVDELAGLLVAAGLWHVAGHTCSRCTQPPPGSFKFHDWSDYGYATREEKQLKDRKAKELKDARIRAEVWARDCVSPDRPREADCRYCGKRVRQKDSRSDPADRAHLDHVDPTLAIGSTNIVVACGGCNSHKGQRQLAQAQLQLRPPPAHNGPQGAAAESPVSPTAVAGPASPASPSAETTVSQGQAAADAGSPAGRPQTPDSPSPAPRERPPARPPVPDHPETTLEPEVESARNAVLARTRADARRSGSGPGSGLGKGQGPGQGEAPGEGQGQGAAPGRRRRRRRGRGGGGRVQVPAEGASGPAAVGSAGQPPEVYVPGRFGSPWAQWSGPPSTVTDTDCDRHGLPQPCRKCVTETE